MSTKPHNLNLLYNKKIDLDTDLQLNSSDSFFYCSWGSYSFSLVNIHKDVKEHENVCKLTRKQLIPDLLLSSLH